MNKNFLKNLNLRLFTLGYNKIKKVSEIKGGLNSKVYLLDLNNKKLVIKIYGDKNKSKIKREKLFYNYLIKINNPNVINPLFFDVKKNFALFPFISGKKIKKIKKKHLLELLQFLNNINKKKKFTNLPFAIDGINDRNQHIKLCEKKINELKKIKVNYSIKKDFKYFLKKKLIPKFAELKENFNNTAFQKFKKIKINKNQMVISPSDLGFHNIIYSKKKLVFFDFEYAGLDDPIKLICDFFCQPDQSLSVSQKEIFIKKIYFKNYTLSQIKSYTKIFLPFHKLKWCCIILNVFKNKNKGFKKKNFLMRSQLIKANKYFTKNFKN